MNSYISNEIKKYINSIFLRHFVSGQKYQSHLIVHHFNRDFPRKIVVAPYAHSILAHAIETILLLDLDGDIDIILEWVHIDFSELKTKFRFDEISKTKQILIAQLNIILYQLRQIQYT